MNRPMHLRILGFSAACLSLAVSIFPYQAAAGAQLPPGYTLETIDPPEGVRLEVGGLAFTSEGTLLICTRVGEVWAYRPGEERAGGQWRRFADGLHEPLGVAVDPETDAIYVGQRAEITQLIDEDGDGVADLYRKVGGGWGYSGNYHEYAFGPVRDSQGNFFMTLNLAHAPGVQESVMGRLAPHRGWGIKIDPEGEFLPLASGMRSPAGLGINDRDEVFFTDNQGDWIASSSLHHLVEGRFYGHPSSLADHPRFEGRDLDAIPTHEFARMVAPPAVWFIHRELADSPGEVTFNYTGGRFGPFDDQIFVGDQNRANVTRIVLEKIGGEYQGVAFEFMNGLASGCVRSVFGPDGSLWLGQVDHGWGNVGGKPFALQRLVWDGETIPFEIQSISLLPDGFRLTFTKPVDEELAADPGNFALKYWHYHYHAEYGSDKVGEAGAEVESIALSEGGRVVDLKLARLHAGRVYEIALPTVASEEGELLTNGKGWYTLNRLVGAD